MALKVVGSNPIIHPIKNTLRFCGGYFLLPMKTTGQTIPQSASLTAPFTQGGLYGAVHLLNHNALVCLHNMRILQDILVFTRCFVGKMQIPLEISGEM